MKIAIAQISSEKDKSHNKALAVEAIQDAKEQGAELVVFPEALMQGFGTGRLDEQAEPLDGDFVSTLDSLAQELDIAIVGGIFCPAGTKDGINRISNAAVVLRPGEKPLAYKKIHTYDAFGYQESETVAAGDELITFDYQGICFGLAVCYDVRFPQQFRQLARQGAEAILVPASWAAGDDKLAQWQLLTRARALDSVSVIIAVDQATPTTERKQGAPAGIGHSAVIDPTGKVIKELGSASEVALISVPIKDLVTDARKALPVLDYEW